MTCFTHRLSHLCFLLPALLLGIGCAGRPDKHHLVEGLSPDGRLGVTIPMINFDGPQFEDFGNRLVEVKTGNVIADLDVGDWRATDHMNHGGWAAKWNAEGTLLCFGISGKWSANSVDLVKLKDGGVLWQKNLSPDCQKEILKRTKAADPVRYAHERKAPDGHSTAYPEGFAIDVELADENAPLKLPLKIRVDLNSNVKAGTGDSGDETLKHHVESWLDAVLDEDGRLTFGEFHMGRRPDLRAGWACS